MRDGLFLLLRGVTLMEQVADSLHFSFSCFVLLFLFFSFSFPPSLLPLSDRIRRPSRQRKLVSNVGCGKKTYLRNSSERNFIVLGS